MTPHPVGWVKPTRQSRIWTHSLIKKHGFHSPYKQCFRQIPIATFLFLLSYFSFCPESHADDIPISYYEVDSRDSDPFKVVTFCQNSYGKSGIDIRLDEFDDVSIRKLRRFLALPMAVPTNADLRFSVLTKRQDGLFFLAFKFPSLSKGPCLHLIKAEISNKENYRVFYNTKNTNTTNLVAPQKMQSYQRMIRECKNSRKTRKWYGSSCQALQVESTQIRTTADQLQFYGYEVASAARVAEIGLTSGNRKWVLTFVGEELFIDLVGVTP
jgi:hypothetical protein